MKIKLKRYFWPIGALICLTHFTFWVYTCFPGKLYGDNMMMLAEAIPGGGIGDQHSVLFIWLWRLFNKLFGFGLSYPLVWGLCFWYTGLFMFTLGLFNLLRSYFVLLFVAAFCYLPFINFILCHLPMKDMNMSAVLFASTGMLFWLGTVKHGIQKKLFIIFTLVLFFIAINFRHNAIFAFIPIAFLFAGNILSIEFCRQQFARGKKTLIKLSVLSGVLIAGLAWGKAKFEDKVGDYKNYFVHTSLFEFDLAGISVNINEMMIPKERLRDGITIDSLKKVFKTAGWDPLWGGWGSSPTIVKGGETAEDVTLWFKAWLFTILDNPGTYLKHRCNHFDQFIISKNEYVCVCEWSPEVGQGVLKSLLPIDQQRYLDKFPRESFKILGIEYLRKLEKENKNLEKKVYQGKNKDYHYGEWLFMTYPKHALRMLNYALIFSLTISLLLWLKPKYFTTYQRKIIPFATGIFLSGWVYFMAYFFISISSDWRYTHWSGLSFWIGFCLMIVASIGFRPYYFLLMKAKKVILKAFQRIRHSYI